MTLLRLACVSCGAPLEIGPELSTFACSYCGSQQRVERKGGVVALQKVETAIRAVQRGTDRTAAELALPRLRKELSELESEGKAAVAAALARRASALSGRRMLTLIVFVVIFFAGPILIVWLPTGSSGTASTFLGLAWIASTFAAPIFVYRKTKVPLDETPAIRADFSERFQRIKSHLDANRAILDQLPH
jgi:hypothetical protein